MTPRALSALYQRIISSVDKVVPNKLRPLWLSPAGPKTVFFWAPICKWGLVFAALGDLQRPAEQISFSQPTSVALTGIIWSRYSMIINPKNYLLLAVNFVVFLTNGAQSYRAFAHKLKNQIKHKHV